MLLWQQYHGRVGDCYGRPLLHDLCRELVNDLWRAKRVVPVSVHCAVKLELE